MEYVEIKAEFYHQHQKEVIALLGTIPDWMNNLRGVKAKMPEQKEYQVEIHLAYRWRCDSCLKKNFGELPTAELTDEDAEMVYRKMAGLEQWAELPEGWRDFQMVQTPESVTCKHCGESFGVDADAFGEGRTFP